MPRHEPLTRGEARDILDVPVGANKRELTAARNRVRERCGGADGEGGSAMAAPVRARAGRFLRK